LAYETKLVPSPVYLALLYIPVPMRNRNNFTKSSIVSKHKLKTNS